MPKLFALLLSAMVVSTAPCRAETKTPVLDKWYPALFSADAPALASLLTEDAEIRLEDIGITQTKSEFLDSLGEWKDSIEGASFDWKLDSAAPATDTEATATSGLHQHRPWRYDTRCHTKDSSQCSIRQSFS